MTLSPEGRHRLDKLGEALKRDPSGPAADAYYKWQAGFQSRVEDLRAGLEEIYGEGTEMLGHAKSKSVQDVLRTMERDGVGLSEIPDIITIRMVVRDRATQERVVDAARFSAVQVGQTPDSASHRETPDQGRLGGHVAYHVGDLPLRLEVETARERSFNRLVDCFADIYGEGVRDGRTDRRVNRFLNGVSAMTVGADDGKRLPGWFRELQDAAECIPAVERVSNVQVSVLPEYLQQEVSTHLGRLHAGLANDRGQDFGRSQADQQFGAEGIIVLDENDILEEHTNSIILDQEVDADGRDIAAAPQLGIQDEINTNAGGLTPPGPARGDGREHEPLDLGRGVGRHGTEVFNRKDLRRKTAEAREVYEVPAARTKDRGTWAMPKPDLLALGPKPGVSPEEQRASDARLLAFHEEYKRVLSGPEPTFERAFAELPEVREAREREDVARIQELRGDLKVQKYVDDLVEREKSARQEAYIMLGVLAPQYKMAQQRLTVDRTVATMGQRLNRVERDHLEALVQLRDYQKAHPELAARPHPGTRAYDLARRERQLAGEVVQLERQLDLHCDRGTLKYPGRPPADPEKTLEKAARKWAKFKSIRPLEIEAARAGRGPGGQIHAGYRQAHQFRAAELAQKRSRKRDRPRDEQEVHQRIC